MGTRRQDCAGEHGWAPWAPWFGTHSRSPGPSVLFCIWKSFLKSALPKFWSWNSAPHPGAGGCSTTLPPSFLPVDHRTASSTTDSSQMTPLPFTSSQDHPGPSQRKPQSRDLLLFPRSEEYPAAPRQPPGCGNGGR
ncbi:uncharacterized protein LOC144368470 isoform X2 [Ictidomys tridecemlineatus]